MVRLVGTFAFCALACHRAQPQHVDARPGPRNTMPAMDVAQTTIASSLLDPELQAAPKHADEGPCSLGDAGAPEPSNSSPAGLRFRVAAMTPVLC